MIDIVIVDYNAGEPLERCLASIECVQERGANVGVVCVVVNGELSEAVAQRARRGTIQVVHPNANIGFAAACNRGAALGAAGFILFLNPDTEVSVDALRAPMQYLSSPGQECVGICGVRLMTAGGTVAASCSEFPTFTHTLNKALGLGHLNPARFKTGLMLDWDHGSTRVVDNVMGAFYFVRRELFDRLGGFDERFFVYYEDLDFSRRAKDLGFASVFLHDVSIRHVGRVTTDRIPGRRLYYLLVSRAAYARKHLGVGAELATWLVSLLIEMPARVVLACFRGRPAGDWAVIRAWAGLWKAAALAAVRREG